MISFFCLPKEIKSIFACSFYSVGISVLSIIFSLFFTCLAIIMTTNDNDFIKFMEEDKLFTKLLFSFKFTLGLLFISLVYSIIAYQYFDYFVKSFDDKHKQNKVFFLLFEFLFSYGLIATAQCVYDTIMFSSYRSKFVIKKSNEEAGKKNSC
jgi:phosphoglycerol transferase MdoB-like AlkP superfamily enzyme